jgi:hypothetical protein
MWPASEKRQGTKSRWVEHRQCHKLYGDSTCLGLDREHNFSDLARALLIGESNFWLACDFKELRVAKTAHISTSALFGWYRPFSGIDPLDIRRAKILFTLADENCFDPLGGRATIITTSRASSLVNQSQCGADGFLLDIRPGSTLSSINRQREQVDGPIELRSRGRLPQRAIAQRFSALG